MKCGMRCGAIGLVLYFCAVVALAVMIFANTAHAQVRSETPYGRPVFGFVVLCGTAEPNTAVACAQGRSRDSFATAAECEAAMPRLVEQQLDAIIEEYPRATLRAQWACRTEPGVYDS